MVLDMTDPTFELANAHRWFAKHPNNQAGDLLELEQLTPAQRELMRNTACETPLTQPGDIGGKLAT